LVIFLSDVKANLRQANLGNNHLLKLFRSPS
jgi:hypothetical protein